MTSEEKKQTLINEILEMDLDENDRSFLEEYSEEDLKKFIEDAEQAAKAAGEILKILPDRETMRKQAANTIFAITRNLDPDKLPAKLLENESIRLLADQIRNGKLAEAEDTLRNMKTVTFTKLWREIGNEIKNRMTPETLTQLEKLERIKFFGLMNDKLLKELIRTEPTREVTKKSEKEREKVTALKWAVDMSANTNTMQVPVYVTLYTDEDNKPIENVTMFDTAVLSAIVALAHPTEDAPGGHYPIEVTVDQLFRVMNGKQDVKRIARPKQAEEIENSIEKMRTSKIYIDRTKESEIFNYNVKSTVIDDNLLHARGATIVTENNRRVRGYQVLFEPVLHQYNREKDHVLHVPYKLLDINTSIVENVIEFRNYLLFRIESIYTGALNSTTIKMSTLYKETGILSPDQRLNKTHYKDEDTYKSNVRKQRAKDRKKISDILTDWTNKEYISGFSFSDDNNSIIIVLNQKIAEAREPDKPLNPKLLKI